MKKKLLLTSLASVLTIGAVSGAVALNSTPQHVGADTSIVQTQLDAQNKELANHEARITTNESNIQAVADKTSTPTASAPTTSVSTNTSTQAVLAEQTPAPTPVTITAVDQIPLDDKNIDCKYTYSDGTSYQWHWKTNKTAGQTVNGLSVTYGTCDNSSIGSVKN